MQFDWWNFKEIQPKEARMKYFTLNKHIYQVEWMVLVLAEILWLQINQKQWMLRNIFKWSSTPGDCIHLSSWKYSTCLFLFSFQTNLGFSDIHLFKYCPGAILVRFLMPVKIDRWTCVLFYNKFHWLLSVSRFSLSSFFRSSSFQVSRFPRSFFFRSTSFQVDLKT